MTEAIPIQDDNGAVAAPLPADKHAELIAECSAAVTLARDDRWDDAMPALRALVEQHGRSGELPGSVFAYFGYGVARFERRVREGLKLCNHAIKISPLDSHCFYNLGRVHLLAHDRRKAVKALQQGIVLDPTHRALRELQAGIGIRRKPFLPFLSRDHFLNLLLGRWRERRSPRRSPPDRAIW